MLALYRDGRQPKPSPPIRPRRHPLPEELGIGPARRCTSCTPRSCARSRRSWRLRSSRPHESLPRPLSSFVGRERELDEVSSLLSGGARLLTLHGAGGSGKTRLAIEVAARLTDAYKDGTFWVGLAPLRDSTLALTGTIAQTLGARDDLILFIGEQRMLVLVDNFEQVAEAGTELARVLEGCPNLTFLVTSRELLRVRGEVEYEVQPAERLRGGRALSRALPLSRRQDGRPISCTRLDNLPLAVELAGCPHERAHPQRRSSTISRKGSISSGADATRRRANARYARRSSGRMSC